MPTLAPPVLDHGGPAADRRPSGPRPLAVAGVFLAALVVTVVVLRLVFGPFGGDEPEPDEPHTVATTTTVAAGAPPAATVERPAGVQLLPDRLAQQYLRERFTRTPGETALELAMRLGDLVTPEHGMRLAAEPAPPGSSGSVVEVGDAMPAGDGRYEVDVRLWTYGPDEAPAGALPGDRQVWWVEMREASGVWSVVDAGRV